MTPEEQQRLARLEQWMDWWEQRGRRRVFVVATVAFAVTGLVGLGQEIHHQRELRQQQAERQQEELKEQQAERQQLERLRHRPVRGLLDDPRGGLTEMAPIGGPHEPKQ